MSLVTKELENKANNAMKELHQLNIYMKSIAQSLQKIADRPTPVTAGGQYIIPGTKVTPIPGEGTLYANNQLRTDID